MPPPPRSVGPTPRTPLPPVPPSEAGWNFSGQSQALRTQYVPPGEFASSDFNDWGVEEGGVGSSYLPSAFVGQPVGIHQVNAAMRRPGSNARYNPWRTPRSTTPAPPPRLDIARQRWTFDHFKLLASGAARQLCTCLASRSDNSKSPRIAYRRVSLGKREGRLLNLSSDDDSPMYRFDIPPEGG